MRLTTFLLVFVSVSVSGCRAGEPPVAPDGAPPAESRRVIRPAGFADGRPYSAGVLAGGRLYLAAQGAGGSEGIGPQTRQVMERLGEVLKSAGMDHRHLVKCHVYLASMDDYKGMNEVYGSFFSERVPARTTVEAAGLPEDARVQIGCVGHRDLDAISVVRPPQGSLPAPLGPYSAAVWAGDTLYLSGMGGQFPADRRLPEGLGAQAAQTLVNIRTTLEAADLTFGNVVASTVFMTERGEAGDLDPNYAPAFASLVAPPRTAVFVPRLPGAIKTEITFVASRTEGRRTIAGSGAARGALAGATLYASAESAPDAGGGFDEQFGEVLRRLESALEEAGAGWRDVAHVQIFLSSLDDAEALDRIFRETFPEAPPARTVVGVLPAGGERVQASLVAVRSGE